MPPENVAEMPIYYSIMKDPVMVIEQVRKIPTAIQQKIYEAIDNLQTNPRPDGHEVVPARGFLRFSVDNYTLLYEVNDEAKSIFVIAVMRFQ